MPNHVTSLMEINGSKQQIEEIKEKIGSIVQINGGDSSFLFPDFNKIIKMPEELNISSRSDGDTGYCVIKRTNLSRFNDLRFAQDCYDRKSIEEKVKCIELGLKYVKNEIKHGHKTWYDWSVANWGTKWNAYDCLQVSENEFSFQTAWNAPINIFKKIAVMFSSISITVKYADEDTGSNCGMVTIENGIFDLKILKNGSKEAYELAFELSPDSKQYYKFTGETYEYIEEEE